MFFYPDVLQYPLSKATVLSFLPNAPYFFAIIQNSILALLFLGGIGLSIYRTFKFLTLTAFSTLCDMFHGTGTPSNITSAHEELLKQRGGFASANGDNLGGVWGG